MGKNVQKRVTDITGIELMPGDPTVCPGSRELGIAYCCDKCEYYWICFPKIDLENEAETEDMEVPSSPSKRHKIRMNRIFRERVGGTFLPYPEEDNLYERVRSKLVIKFKINEFSNRHKIRRLTK